MIHSAVWSGKTDIFEITLQGRVWRAPQQLASFAFSGEWF
jgi:hypothetical protein